MNEPFDSTSSSSFEQVLDAMHVRVPYLPSRHFPTKDRGKMKHRVGSGSSLLEQISVTQVSQNCFDTALLESSSTPSVAHQGTHGVAFAQELLAKVTTNESSRSSHKGPHRSPDLTCPAAGFIGVSRA